MTFQFFCSCRLTLMYCFPSSFFKQIFTFILKPKLQNPHFSHAWKRKYQSQSRLFAGRSVSQSRTIPWSVMRACCQMPSLTLCNHQHIANRKPERRAGQYTRDQEGGLGNAQSQWSTSSASRHLLRFCNPANHYHNWGLDVQIHESMGDRSHANTTTII